MLRSEHLRPDGFTRFLKQNMTFVPVTKHGGSAACPENMQKFDVDGKIMCLGVTPWNILLSLQSLLSCEIVMSCNAVKSVIYKKAFSCINLIFLCYHNIVKHCHYILNKTELYSVFLSDF